MVTEELMDVIASVDQDDNNELDFEEFCLLLGEAFTDQRAM